MNNCVFVGRLTKDPEIELTTGGKKYSRFSLAVSRQDKNKTTDFIPCIVWEARAEALANFTAKGAFVGVSGKLTSRKYEDANGNKKTAYEVLVESLSFLSKKDENQAPAPTPTPPAPTPAPPAPPQVEQMALDDYLTNDDQALPFDIM